MAVVVAVAAVLAVLAVAAVVAVAAAVAMADREMVEVEAAAVVPWGFCKS